MNTYNKLLKTFLIEETTLCNLIKKNQYAENEKLDIILYNIHKKWTGETSYKKFNKSNFLIIKKMFPFLYEFNTLYRFLFIDKNVKNVRQHILDNYKHDLISFCIKKEHFYNISKQWKKPKNTKLYIIKQKSMSLEISSILSILECRQISNKFTINDWLYIDGVKDDEISEHISILNKDFKIIKL